MKLELFYGAPNSLYALIKPIVAGFRLGKEANKVCRGQKRHSGMSMWPLFVPIRIAKERVCVDAALKIETGAICFMIED